MKTLIACLASLTLIARASAQEQPAAPSAQSASAGTLAPALAVDVLANAGALEDASIYPLFDRPGDGALWVRGENYKARFDAQGVRFIPFLGADAPRNHPLDMQLESASLGARAIAFDASAMPEQEENRVVFHRGALDEVYVIGPRSIEQVFLLREQPERGELAIRMRTHSEFEARSGSAGVRFSNELGGVGYGRATTTDALQRALPTRTELVGDVLEIGVPAQAIDASAFPLTIDPVIFAFTVVDVVMNSPMLPDTSYDLSTDTWISVFQQTFSAADHDIVASRFNGSGGLIGTAFVDFTGTDWTRPRVANNNAQNQFMVVAEVAVGLPFSRIGARTVSAATAAMGAQFNVSPPSTTGVERFVSPDIGGDDYPLGTPAYCVVYIETGAGVWASRVSPVATVFPRVQLETANWPANIVGPVRMSKSNGHWSYGDQRWTVGWMTTFGSQLRQVALSGQPTGSGPKDGGFEPTFSISPLLDEYGPARRFAVADTIPSAGVFADTLFVSVESMDAAGNLQFMQWGGGGFWERNGFTKLNCSIETDGVRFHIAYTELSPSGTNSNIFYATLAYDGMNGYMAQSHVAIAASGFLSEAQPSLASKHSSGSVSQDTLCVWKRFAGTTKGNTFTDAILATLFY